MSGTEKLRCLEDYIEEVTMLCERCNNFQGLSGHRKLFRKCRAERNFLISLINKHHTLVERQLKSSNLAHLSGIQFQIENSINVISVLSNYCDEEEKNCIIDVVCQDGMQWRKVIARNPSALHLIWAGKGEYGLKSVVEQARRIKRCATSNTVHYQPPSVVFIFTRGVTKELRQAVEREGVCVEGNEAFLDDNTKARIQLISNISDDSEDDDWSLSDGSGNSEIFSSGQSTGKVNSNKGKATDFVSSSCLESLWQPVINLDVSTMICLVSNLCHGFDHFVFEDKVLTELAAEERSNALLPTLDKFMYGKKLILCKTALKTFHGILYKMGGPNERERSEILMEKIEIVADNVHPAVQALKISAKVKAVGKVIFGTGLTLRAVTMTANHSFVRATQHQHLKLPVFLHGSRALTEQKQQMAESTSYSNHN